MRAVDDLLVGFKYIAETMDRLGPEKFVFGAEESLGYLAGAYARDKDASVAALYLLNWPPNCAAKAKRCSTGWTSYIVSTATSPKNSDRKNAKAQGQQQIAQLMDEFRNRPPAALAGYPLDRVRDYGKHEFRSLPSNARSGDLPRPSGNLLFLESLQGAFRFSIAVRPSGTEPKIKFYFFAQAPCDDPRSLSALKDKTEGALKAVQDALSDWVRQAQEACHKA